MATSLVPSLGLTLFTPHSQKVLLKTVGMPHLLAPRHPQANTAYKAPPGWSPPAFSSLTSDPPAANSRLPTPVRSAFFSSQMLLTGSLCLQPFAHTSTAPQGANSSDFFRPEMALPPGSHLCPARQPSALPSQGPGHPGCIRTVYCGSPSLNCDLHGGGPGPVFFPDP